MPLIGGGRLAEAILERLGAPEGPVAVAFDRRLARALAERGLEVVTVSDNGRDLEKAPGRAVPWADAAGLEVEAAVIAGAAQRPGGAEAVATLARVVGPGAAVVLVDRAPRPAASRCALFGGLSRIDQTVAARTVVTSGEVGEYS